ncbi:5-(carboxyamino)imidazole ribonucleotide synthase [Halobacteriales archaeon QS_3_64_16]|nr:MAG: 5-(carboxyamino)imidazole ribonucleotide synthase [Halobacteriales archaeon QS_3_64_16]
MVTLTSPSPVVGVIGGGQLGRMLGEAAGPLGVETVVSDPTADPPAAPVTRDQLQGAFDDPEVVEALAARADVLTYEIELADPDLLEQASEKVGVPVHPSPATLRFIQDKLVQKRRLKDAGIPVPAFKGIDSPDDLRDALDDLGAPAMVKARRGGYDGRGNAPLEDPADAEALFEELGGEVMAEATISFERELSVIGVKGAEGIRTFPVTETIHQEEILRETISPARTDERTRERAQQVARDVLEVMDGRGVYGIELFEVGEEDSESTETNREGSSGSILVNEIAPRPHNSGHWTIEGALTSQFEQHLRAVLGWPLGATDRRAPTALANVLGDVSTTRPAELRGVESVLSRSGTSLHWYGKREVRPLRKMGHLTRATTDSSDDPDDLLEDVRSARDALTFES